MLETPSIITVSESVAAVVRMTLPRREMQTALPPAIRELRGALREQGLAPTGAMFIHHLRMDDAVFDFEVGFPTMDPVLSVGRIQPGLLPPGPVARATFLGSYGGLSGAWSSFRQWIEENGYERTPNLWEVYLAGPELSADPLDWRTELNQPVLIATHRA